MVVSELKTKLNEKIECLESKLRNELATQLSTELTKLKNELILRIGYVDIHKKEAMNIFDFKVPDLVLNQKKAISVHFSIAMVWDGTLFYNQEKKIIPRSIGLDVFSIATTNQIVPIGLLQHHMNSPY